MTAPTAILATNVSATADNLTENQSCGIIPPYQPTKELQMAYVSQDLKAKLAPTIKAILKKYGVKGTLSVRNHMSLVLTLKSGKIDFIENYITTDANKHYGQPMSAEQVAYIRKNSYLDVNTYWIGDHYSGKAKAFLLEMKAAMEGPDFFNEDDAQTDYFHRSHYIDILVGKWNKPYIVTK